MGTKTGIEWTDATWNPVWGCSRVSEGCRNCYAETVAQRFSGPGGPYEGLVRIGADGKRKAEWNGTVRFVEEHLLDPLKWRTLKDHAEGCEHKHRPSWCRCPIRSQRIFVNSMSDLFHEGVTDEQLDRIFAVMALCPQHTFQVLTKRPERMLAYLTQVSDERDMQRWTQYADEFAREMKWTDWPEPEWPLPNVWLGVSVEDQKTADARIPLLLQTPAAVRFISAEPLLGAISLEELPSVSGIGRYLDALDNSGCQESDIPHKLDWVICGGESGKGPGIRPTHPDWVRGLRDQCVSAGVPFFFKQWGEWAPGAQQADYARAGYTRIDVNGNPSNEPTLWRASDALFYRVGKKSAGHLLDGEEWRQFPAAGRDGVGADDTFCHKLTERTDQYVAGPAR